MAHTSIVQCFGLSISALIIGACGAGTDATGSSPEDAAPADVVDVDSKDGGGLDASSDSALDASSEDGGNVPVCQPGKTEPCYSGPPQTVDVGACRAGVRVCASDGSGFGDCLLEVTPAVEVCATPVDDDCDGEVNEDGADCACKPGAVVPCYSASSATMNVGACKPGVQVCKPDGTGYGACTGEVTPSAESCLNDIDDDCDGSVNEEGAGCLCVPGAQMDCYEGPSGTENVGACKSGTSTCDPLGTSWSACAGQVLPVAETCATAADDDCDGVANESGADCVCSSGQTAACYTGPLQTINVGACKPGAQQCNSTGSGFGACTGEVTPQTESCATYFDDDCDALPECSGDALWTATRASAAPSTFLTTESTFAASVMLDAGGGQNIRWMEYDDTGKLKHDVPMPFGAKPVTLASDACCPRVITAGTYGGSPTFGADTLPFTTTKGFFVAGSTGLQPTWAWAKGFPGSFDGPMFATIEGGAVRVVASSAIGDSVGSGALGGGPFVADFLSTNSQSTWSRTLKTGGSGTLTATGLAHVNGSSYVVGRIQGTVDYGTGPITSSGEDIFIAVVKGGNVETVHKFGGPQYDTAIANPIALNWELPLAGKTSGGLDFGGGALPAGMFVAMLQATGAHVWSKSIGNCEPLAIRGNYKTIYVLADCNVALDLGSGLLPAGMVLMKLKATDGSFIWSRPLPASTWPSLAMTQGGIVENVYHFGWASTPLDFGTGVVASGVTLPGTFVTRLMP